MVESYTATKKNDMWLCITTGTKLTNLILKERGQTLKNINEIIPFIESSKPGKTLYGVRSQLPGSLWGRARGVVVGRVMLEASDGVLFLSLSGDNMSMFILLQFAELSV